MVKNTDLKSALAFVVCVLNISFNSSIQVSNNDATVSYSQTLKDTNVIVDINYPPLTDREGKGLPLAQSPIPHPRFYLIAKDTRVLQQNQIIRFCKKCLSRIMHAAGLKLKPICF